MVDHRRHHSIVEQAHKTWLKTVSAMSAYNLSAEREQLLCVMGANGVGGGGLGLWWKRHADTQRRDFSERFKLKGVCVEQMIGGCGAAANNMLMFLECFFFRCFYRCIIKYVYIKGKNITWKCGTQLCRGFMEIVEILKYRDLCYIFQ